MLTFDYDTKEKEHQNTRQSDKYSGATPPRINQVHTWRQKPKILCCQVRPMQIIPFVNRLHTLIDDWPRNIPCYIPY
jgi:hypothetical protein